MIDTHCHIDDEAFEADLAEVIAHQQAAGVEAIVVPGVNAASVQSVQRVCAAYPDYLFPALGLHPEDVHADWQAQLEPIRQALYAAPERYVAVGEIGLDYHWDVTFKAEQQEVLRTQLRLARELDLPVIIHNRESTEDVIRILRQVAAESGAHPLRGVFHCFNGSRETAEILLSMGFVLGIGGVLTFKNCKLSDTLASVPLDRLVLETDAPYLAPVPHRGTRNQSAYMIYVVDRLCEVYNCTPKEVIQVTNATAKRLFWPKNAKK